MNNEKIEDNKIILRQSFKIDIINYLFLFPTAFLSFFYFALKIDYILIGSYIPFLPEKVVSMIFYSFLALIALNSFINVILRKVYYKYEISDTGVKSREGLLYIKTTQIRNDAIRTVTANQNLLQMILNIGNIEISSSDMTDTVVMKNIDNPRSISEKLERKK